MRRYMIQLLACEAIQSLARNMKTRSYGFGGYGTDVSSLSGLLIQLGYGLTLHEILGLLVAMHREGRIYLQNWDWTTSGFRPWRSDWDDFFIRGFRLLDKKPA